MLCNGQPSDCLSVTSEVPQGSVLAPILLTIYINDQEIGLIPTKSKFAGDIKMGVKGLTKTECDIIQKELIYIIE